MMWNLSKEMTRSGLSSIVGIPRPIWCVLANARRRINVQFRSLMRDQTNSPENYAPRDWSSVEVLWYLDPRFAGILKSTFEILISSIIHLIYSVPLKASQYSWRRPQSAQSLSTGKDCWIALPLCLYLSHLARGFQLGPRFWVLLLKGDKDSRATQFLDPVPLKALCF